MQNALDMLLERGLAEQISDEETLRKRFASESVILYAGFDPTANSLHLGHLFSLLPLSEEL